MSTSYSKRFWNHSTVANRASQVQPRNKGPREWGIGEQAKMPGGQVFCPGIENHLIRHLAHRQKNNGMFEMRWMHLAIQSGVLLRPGIRPHSELVHNQPRTVRWKPPIIKKASHQPPPPGELRVRWKFMRPLWKRERKMARNENKFRIVVPFCGLISVGSCPLPESFFNDRI